MNVSLSSWLLIVLALLTANLPFVNQRLFGLLALSAFPSKPFWLRLFELLTAYVVVGLLGFFFETSAGNRFVQNWEFYWIGLFVFIVFAFPGFVYCYLRKQKRAD